MDDEYKFWQYLVPYEASKYTMGLARTIHNKGKLSLRNIKYNIETGSEPQSVFLLDRARQKRYMLRNGYTVDNTGDYGLVKKSVGNRNLPIYRTPDLYYNNDGHMNVLGNIYAQNSSKWLGKTGAIIHGGDYPTALYYNDKDNYFYQKGWDLNDYGKDENKERKGTYSTYDNFERFAANALDFIGNPMVISTGYRQTPYNINNITLDPGRTRHPTAFITLQRQFNTWLKKHKGSSMINPYINNNGLTDQSMYYDYVLDDNGDIAYDNNGMPKIDYSKPKKQINKYTIVNTTKIPEVIAKRKHKTLGGIY